MAILPNLIIPLRKKCEWLHKSMRLHYALCLWNETFNLFLNRVEGFPFWSPAPLPLKQSFAIWGLFPMESFEDLCKK